MSLENRVKAEPCAGAFSDCLVDGNSEQTARQRKIKRRALAISIAIQTAGMAALIIAPLFAKPPELVGRNATPIPPYSRSVQRHERTAAPNRPTTRVCLICAPTRIPPRIPTFRNDDPPTGPTGPTVDIGPIGPGNLTNLLSGVDRGPQPPPDDPSHDKRRVHVTKIDPALLTHRVEPQFPALARQIHRNGKVELRALIATDGTVQSLEVVSGDPLFVQSALDAVKQWRYRPTFLNGQAVEVDTYITVIYTLQ